MKEQKDSLVSLKESLSALMDNEATELELRRVLKAMEKGDSDQSLMLKESWYRYHIVRTQISEQAEPTVTSGFLAGIQAEINKSTPDFPSELPVSNDARKAAGGNTFVKVIGQGLIAASVALLAITLSFNLLNDENPQDNFDVADTTEAANLTARNGNEPNFTSELDPQEFENVRRAVYRGLEDGRSLEVPVSFSLDDYQD